MSLSLFILNTCPCAQKDTRTHKHTHTQLLPLTVLSVRLQVLKELEPDKKGKNRKGGRMMTGRKRVQALVFVRVNGCVNETDMMRSYANVGENLSLRLHQQEKRQT